MCATTYSVKGQRASEAVPRNRVELILNQLDQLASPPAVAMQLLTLTTSDDASLHEVVRIVESDAALTAAILRLSRRADLGIRKDIVTVERAVALLGFNALRNTVLSSLFFTTLESHETDDARERSRREIWLHSLAVACAADMFAEKTKPPSERGVAFVCGLLHDIGKIALDTCLPKSYARVMADAERRRRCICDVERDLLGLDHTTAGKRLATRWCLPEPITECAWLHHHAPDGLPSSTANGNLLRLIHLADNLVRRQRIGFSGYHHVADLEDIAAPLGIDRRVIDEIAESLPKRMAPYCELVGLDRDRSESLYAESVIKANRELSALNHELVDRNRQLERRSRCFQALRTLTTTGSENACITDVCVAAAGAVSGMLECEEAAVFAVTPTSDCVQVGVTSAGALPAGYIAELDQETRAALFASLQTVEEGELTGVPGPADSIVATSIRFSSHEPRWLFSFGDRGGLLGGVVFAAPQMSVARWQAAREECRALASAVRLALESAYAGERADRTTEELLDINRRLKLAQGDLVRARSISMVGEMAAGAAHELNNPLSVISGRAQLALQDSTDEQISRWLKLIVEQAHTASEIVSELMNFAKPKPPDPVSIRVRTLLESAYQRCYQGSSLREDQVELRICDDHCTIHADRHQLDTILDAVLANAVEACAPQTTRIVINSPSRVTDETLRIVIEDNGAGMSREVLEHAIDPFFSSRPAGRGRGLGLSRAVRLAEINGGSLWLESTPNVGTVVSIELPARPPSA